MKQLVGLTDDVSGGGVPTYVHIYVCMYLCIEGGWQEIEAGSKNKLGPFLNVCLPLAINATKLK